VLVFQPLLVPNYLTLGYGMLIAWFAYKCCSREMQNGWWQYFLLGLLNYVLSIKEITDFLYDRLIKLGSNAALQKKAKAYLRGKLNGVSYGFLSYVWPEEGLGPPKFIITVTEYAAQADEKFQEFKQALGAYTDRLYEQIDTFNGFMSKLIPARIYSTPPRPAPALRCFSTIGVVSLISSSLPGINITMAPSARPR